MKEGTKKFFYQFFGGILGAIIGVLSSFFLILIMTGGEMINGIVILFFGLAGLGAGIPLGIISGSTLYKKNLKK